MPWTSGLLPFNPNNHETTRENAELVSCLSRKKNTRAIDFGSLCVDIINRTLGLKLVAGTVHLTARVHAKAATKHDEDYDHVMRHFEACISGPTFLGENPSHPGRIDLVFDVPGRKPVLVALYMRPNRGRYYVATTFATYSATVAKWRRTNWLVPPKPEAPAEPKAKAPPRKAGPKILQARKPGAGYA